MFFSKLSLALIFTVCLSIVIFSFQLCVGNIYQIGLEHELDSFDHVLNCTPTDNACLNNDLKVINDLANSMLEWDSLNPDNLSLASYATLLNYQHRLNQLNDKKNPLILDKSLALNQNSIIQRPVFPDAYAFRTYLLSDKYLIYKKISQSVVFDMYFKAVRFGPYEIPVAKAGINLLYGNWKSLSKQEIHMAIDYIANYKKFGLNDKTVSEIVAQSPQKRTICGIAKFYKAWIKSCQ